MRSKEERGRKSEEQICEGECVKREKKIDSWIRETIKYNILVLQPSEQ